MQNTQTGDNLTQLRDQIEAARKEARDAARNARDQVGTPPPPGTPGTIQPIQFDPNRQIPQQAVDLAVTFFVTVAVVLLGLPIMRAIARRMDRSTAAPQVPQQVTAQLTQLTNAVDAIALEVERISEGQRFATKLLTEQRPEASKTILGPSAGPR